ncbi:MAG: hypothetical protein HRU26_15505 [Psychroserpens sp.]|nr:hypothetical protein [Psychroserpens sp.]
MPRILTIDEVKPLIGNLSRDNYYEMQFGGILPDLQFYLNQRGVESTFFQREWGLCAYDAQLPGTSLADTQSQNFMGVTENFAYQKAYSDLTISFYCDSEYRGLKFLEHWMEYTVSGNGTGTNPFYPEPGYGYRLKYPDQYKSNSTKIFKFETRVERVLEYSFIGLFPKAINPVSISYGPKSGSLGNILKINCTFKYDRFIAGSIDSFARASRRSNNLISTIRDITNRGQEAVNLVNRFVNLVN